MPAKNSLKPYIADSLYHIYNRGVEKRDIFLDEEDYKTFINCLRQFFSPKEKTLNKVKENSSLTLEEKSRRILLISRQNNFFGKIDFLAYVLMPNHFHFL